MSRRHLIQLGHFRIHRLIRAEDRRLLIQIQLLKVHSCLAGFYCIHQSFPGLLSVQSIPLYFRHNLIRSPIIIDIGVSRRSDIGLLKTFHLIHNRVYRCLVICKIGARLVGLAVPDRHDPGSRILFLQKLFNASVIHVFHVQLLRGNFLGLAVSLRHCQSIFRYFILKISLHLFYRLLTTVNPINYCTGEKVGRKMFGTNQVDADDSDNKCSYDDHHNFRVFR